MLPSLKITTSLHLKMDGWKTFSFPFWDDSLFSAVNWLLVSGEYRYFYLEPPRCWLFRCKLHGLFDPKMNPLEFYVFSHGEKPKAPHGRHVFHPSFRHLQLNSLVQGFRGKAGQLLLQPRFPPSVERGGGMMCSRNFGGMQKKNGWCWNIDIKIIKNISMFIYTVYNL